MLQWLYTDVTKVYYQCFICVFLMHVTSLFIWMLHMFHTYAACVLSGCLYGCNGFQGFLGVFYVFHKHVSNVLEVRLICVFRTHVAIVFIWMLHVFYLDVAYGCNGFHVFSGIFSKCFRSMFQVFHLPLDVCCNCCIWMFQKQIGCCISPPRLLLHRLNVSSLQRR